MWKIWLQKPAIDIELRPWEARVLEQAKAGDFTPYVELSYAYLILDNPRSDLLLRAFKKLIKDQEASRRFLAYCQHHQSGGVTGQLKC